METKSKASQWEGHLQAWRASGLSQPAYCAQHSLKPSHLAYWLGKQRKTAPPLTLIPVPLATPLTAPPCTERQAGDSNSRPDWIADLLRRLS